MAPWVAVLGYLMGSSGRRRLMTGVSSEGRAQADPPPCRSPSFVLPSSCQGHTQAGSVLHMNFSTCWFNGFNDSTSHHQFWVLLSNTDHVSNSKPSIYKNIWPTSSYIFAHCCPVYILPSALSTTISCRPHGAALPHSLLRSVVVDGARTHCSNHWICVPRELKETQCSSTLRVKYRPAAASRPIPETIYLYKQLLLISEDSSLTAAVSPSCS